MNGQAPFYGLLWRGLELGLDHSSQVEHLVEVLVQQDSEKGSPFQFRPALRFPCAVIMCHRPHFPAGVGAFHGTGFDSEIDFGGGCSPAIFTQ